MEKRRVVVTGLGLVSCFGNDVDTFYQKLLSGDSGVAEIEKFDASEFPTHIAAEIKNFDPSDYMDKKQARRVDPFISYTMAAGKMALENAGIFLDTVDKARCGILIGSGMGGMNVFFEGVNTLLTKSYKRLTPFFVPYIITNMGGALLAIDTGFQGPNYSISTACATGSNSIYSAATEIQMGKADLMLCGGSESPINPIGLAGFVAVKALSTRNHEPQKASRPWDIDRDGFVMGEGAGVLVLESLEHAKKRGATILAEYKGGAINCDAFHMTAPLENGSGVKTCIEQALKDASLPKEKISYINAHATATPVGDICEINAIKSAFGEHSKNIKINGTKSMIGHCLGAAGGLESIATIKAIQTKKLHPTINLENPDPGIAGMDIIGSKQVSYDGGAALCNTFGFGGHNAVLVFSPYAE